MNVDKLSLENAFDAGSELWIIPDQQNKWWQELDYHSGFLLSLCKLHQKTKSSSKIEEILKETQIEKKDFASTKKCLLVGTEDHFHNKWILVIPDSSAQTFSEMTEILNSLKIHSIRFFSTPSALIESVSTRLLTSLNRISFVE